MVAVATVLLIGLPASSARAAGVPVPLHRAPWVNLGLIAGSDAGFVVGMTHPIEIATQSVLIGAPGTRLREHVLTPSATAQISWLNLVGQQVGYVIARSRTATKYEMHQLNVVTGADTNLGTVGQLPFAFTADSWIGLADNYLISTPFTGGAATRIAPLDGARPSSYRTTDGAMLIRRANADRTQYSLDLVDFASKSVSRVATEKSIADFSISPTTIAWASNAPQTGKPVTVTVLARSGGTPFVYSETNRDAEIWELAAGDTSVGYVINRTGVSYLRTIGASGLVSTVRLPYYTSALLANGSGWLISVSGRRADAGVYSVQGSTVDRQATVTGPHVPTVGLSFAAGRLYYTDDSNVDDGAPLGARGPMPVWSRPVNGLGSPKLGNESELAQRTAHLPAYWDTAAWRSRPVAGWSVG